MLKKLIRKASLSSSSSDQADNHRRRSQSSVISSGGIPESTTQRYAPPTGLPPPSYNNSVDVSSGSSRSVQNPFESDITKPVEQRPIALAEGEEDPFDFLKRFDTVFLIDDSGSMAGGRWRECRDALASVVSTAARYDDDGLDVHFLNSARIGHNLKSPAQVLALFESVSPRGGTPTGTRLEKLLNDHISLLERSARDGKSEEIKPLNLVVLTDGEPTDDPRSVIIAAAKRLDRGNFPLAALGIFFLQIGNDAKATEALNELDDDLGSDIRDIVDTCPYKAGQRLDQGYIEKVLMGGVNRRLDRKKV
ncbi:von Willebrand factor, type A [Phaffia rhodozyma]|uniref:von Willebrand factor, type A n=1 Tax=Phaffia rhodozyma TaxID=264483 RepID=A0A0F7SWX3_PHARH|nr:von Willebrand factor, type A [Phaffia rhodozyma]